MSRTVLPFNQNWLFNPQFDPAHVQTDCAEEGFTQVILPHTNRLFPVSGFDDQDFQFVSSYRKHFKLPEGYKGKRIFVDFAGAMAAAKVYLNGTFLVEHKGGYTPFAVDMTETLSWAGENVLAVELDSRERPDIPPFGGLIDYLTFGGLYREVSLRIVSPLFIENVFVKPRQVTESDPYLEVVTFLNHLGETGADLQVKVAILKDGNQVLHNSQSVKSVSGGTLPVTIRIDGCQALERWDLEHPVLYHASISLSVNGQEVDRYVTRFGFRECQFTPEGFTLNGRRIQLRGLNRHQTFPWVGAAMPARVQRRDAEVLRKEFKVNVVRTSHYPQSPHFLDRCDELGLLVFEEIPGWQYIGDKAWQEVSCQNVAEMVQRDWNHPAIILWGTRINESKDNDEFYTRTNAVAKGLDDTRQTGGVRYEPDSNLIEDVFTFNDFNPVELMKPKHPRHLVTEYCGHMYSTKHCDNTERLTEHTRRHAHIQSVASTTPGLSGAIGWCAFDYNTHKDFGSGDRICHHGVADLFRIPKFAAMVYKAQCDPKEEIVLEPAFHWALGDIAGAGGVGDGLINSNCDSLKLYVGNTYIGDVFPCRERFPGLPHPPFVVGKELAGLWGTKWKPLKIEGYLNGQLVITRELANTGLDTCFEVFADDTELVGDGSDATRVWFRVTDEYHNPRNFAIGAIQFKIEGPGEIIGDNPFPLIGGCGAIWVRSRPASGTAVLEVTHPYLGTQLITIQVTPEQIEEI